MKLGNNIKTDSVTDRNHRTAGRRVKTGVKAGLSTNERNETEASRADYRSARWWLFTFALALAGAVSAQPLLRNDSHAARQAHHNFPGARITAGQREALAAYGPDIAVVFGDNEVPTALAGKLSPRTSPNDPVAEAQAALKLHAPAFRIRPDDGFSFIALEQNGSGLSVRMAQMYRGIPVIDAAFVVYLSQESVTGIRGRFVADLNVQFGSALSAAEAAARAVSFARDHGYRNPQVVETRAPAIFVDGDGIGHLAVPVEISQDGPESMAGTVLFTDAVSGDILGSKALAPQPAACCFPAPANALLNPTFNPQGFDWNWNPVRVPWNGYGAGPVCTAWPCSTTESKSITDILPGLSEGAKLNGFSWKSGVTSLYQTVKVPWDAVSATLKFYLRIDAWSSSHQITDWLKVGIFGNTTAGFPYPGICCDLSVGEQQYTNLDNMGDPFGYYLSKPLTVNVSYYRGQSITVGFLAQQGRDSVNAFYLKNASLTFSNGSPIGN